MNNFVTILCNIKLSHAQLGKGVSKSAVTTLIDWHCSLFLRLPASTNWKYITDLIMFFVILYKMAIGKLQDLVLDIAMHSLHLICGCHLSSYAPWHSCWALRGFCACISANFSCLQGRCWHLSWSCSLPSTLERNRNLSEVSFSTCDCFW